MEFEEVVEELYEAGWLFLYELIEDELSETHPQPSG